MVSRDRRPASAARTGASRALAAQTQGETAALAQTKAKTAAPAQTAGTGRIDVRKTYKLYIGGAFPRTESGRSYVVAGADGSLLKIGRASCRERVLASV